MFSKYCKKYFKLLVILAFLLNTGFASKGRYFTEVTNPPEGQARIYIYNPPSKEARNQRFKIRDKGKKIKPSFKTGQYITFCVEPGSHLFHNLSIGIRYHTLPLETEPDKIYFILLRVNSHHGTTNEVFINLVDEKTALKGLKKCRLKK